MSVGFEGGKFRFPNLTPEEAVANCNSMFESQVKLTLEDVLHPQSQQIKRFYIGVLSSFGVCPEKLTQPQFKSMERFEHPELHTESAPLVILSLAMNRFMFACGVENFNIFDIADPKPKRTLHFLSAIVNFTKFKATRSQVYENAMAEVDTAVEQKEHLLSRNQELKDKIQELKVKKVEREKKEQKAATEVQELQSSVAELNKKQAAEAKSLKQMKAANAELTSKKAEIKASIAGLKQDNERLKSKIVQSPEKFKGELARLTSAVQSIREIRGERSVRLQELSTQLENNLQVTEDSQTALKMLTGIGEQLEQLREKNLKAEQLKEENIGQRELLRDLTVKVEHLRRQHASKLDKLSRLERQHDKRIAATRDASKELEREQTHLERKLKETEKHLEILQSQKKILIEEDKENKKMHQQQVDKLYTTYQQLLKQLESYHCGLAKAWDKVKEAAK